MEVMKRAIRAVYPPFEQSLDEFSTRSPAGIRLFLCIPSSSWRPGLEKSESPSVQVQEYIEYEIYVTKDPPVIMKSKEQKYGYVIERSQRSGSKMRVCSLPGQ